jgi:hypothetical protein
MTEAKATGRYAIANAMMTSGYNGRRAGPGCDTIPANANKKPPALPTYFSIMGKKLMILLAGMVAFWLCASAFSAHMAGFL